MSDDGMDVDADLLSALENDSRERSPAESAASTPMHSGPPLQPTSADTTVARRGRGRPRGSKNRNPRGRGNGARAVAARTLSMPADEQSDAEGGRGHGIDVRGATFAQAAEVMEDIKNKQRQLEPITEIGLGPHNPTPMIAGAPDQCPVRCFSWVHQPRAVPYRCALHESKPVGDGTTNKRLLRLDAFGDSRIRDAVTNEKMMTDMAELWWTPNSKNALMRRLPSDTLPARPPRRDLKGEALYFLRHTTLPTEEAPRNAFAESAVDEIDSGCPVQHHCDRHSAIKLANDMGNGGIEGSNIVLFHVDRNNHNHGMLDPNFNKLVSVLAQCIYTPDIPQKATLMPAISTQFSEAQCSQQKVYNMMRFAMNADPSAHTRVYNYPQSRDMNQEWLRKVMQFRLSKGKVPEDVWPDHPGVIPESSQINDPDLEPSQRVLCDEDLVITDKLEKFGLFRMHLHVGLHPAVNKDGCEECLQMSVLRIRGLPFADPIVALQQLVAHSVGENDLKETLMDVVRNMAAVLKVPDQNISIKSLFNSNLETNAATLFGEENLVKAVFMKAHQLGFTDVDVGGRRMDVTCPREMSLHKKYCTLVQHARRSQWRHVETSVGHTLSHAGSQKTAQNGEIVSSIVHFEGFNFIGITRQEFHDAIASHILEDMKVQGEFQLCDLPECLEDDSLIAEFLERRHVLESEQGYLEWARRNEAMLGNGNSEPVPQLYGRNGMYYKMVGSQSFYNHGILISIDTMAVEQFWKTKQGKDTHTNVNHGVFLPLRSTSLMMDLFFDNELHFDFLLDAGNHHVLDENYMKDKMSKLHPDLLKVYHSLQQWRVKMRDPKRSKCKQRIKQQTILSFCGKAGPHPIDEQVQSIRSNSELLAQANLILHTSRQFIRKALDALAHGPMLQLQRTAEAMLHLREISMDSSITVENGFIDFHLNWRSYRKHRANDLLSRQSHSRREFMNGEAVGIDFHNKWWQSQEMDIHFQNTLAIDSIHNSLIAMFVGTLFAARARRYRCLTAHHIRRHALSADGHRDAHDGHGGQHGGAAQGAQKQNAAVHVQVFRLRCGPQRGSGRHGQPSLHRPPLAQPGPPGLLQFAGVAGQELQVHHHDAAALPAWLVRHGGAQRLVRSDGQRPQRVWQSGRVAGGAQGGSR